MSRLKSLVCFESAAFNTSETKDYFINPECYGDDLAIWLSRELHARGIDVDENLIAEDFGWAFNFSIGAFAHTVVITHIPSDDEMVEWMVYIERSHGLLKSLFGFRARGIQQAAIDAIADILAKSPAIFNIRWSEP